MASKANRVTRQSPALVCRGPDCRGRSQERLCEELRAAGASVLIVGCLGVCRGPVAMLSLGDRWEVVCRIRGSGRRKRLVRALARQRSRGIRKRIVRGPRRRQAIAKGVRKLARRYR